MRCNADPFIAEFRTFDINGDRRLGQDEGLGDHPEACAACVNLAAFESTHPSKLSKTVKIAAQTSKNIEQLGTADNA